MVAQPASTNDRRVPRLSISTTTTTLTPSTKAYATPPSSQAIPSSSSSSALAPTLVNAFVSLAVEVPRPPQQQDADLRTAECCSQNASQSAELGSVIVTRSTEHRSSTAAQLAEPRAQASARSPRTNRRDDEKQQNSLKSGTKVLSDSVDRLVKGIGTVQINQPSASTHSQTTSPPVPATPATPANQKRGRSDYEEENSIEDRLAKLYVDPPPPPPATSTSALVSRSTPAVTPLPKTSTTAMTICTSMLHNRPVKISSKGNERSESQLESYRDRLDIALHNLIAAHKLAVTALTCESHRRHDTYMQREYAHTQYLCPHMQYLSTQLTDPARNEYLRKQEQTMTGSHRKYEEARNEYLRKQELAMIESQRKYDKAWTESQRKYNKVWIESQQKYDKVWIESQQKYDKAWAESQQKYDKAWAESQQKYDKAWIESQQKYDKAWIESQQKYDKAWIESQGKYDKAWIESQQKYDKEWIESERVYAKKWKESQRNYEQVSEQLEKSIQDSRNKPAQQHRQLSQSYHQTPPQYKQGLEELDGKSPYPLISKDAGTVSSSSPKSVSDGSREDGVKTSGDHERRRKRVKHDDIKKEPVDEAMSDAATATTSISTTTSTASITSTFSTSSGHTVADVTLDMQNKLNFISQ